MGEMEPLHQVRVFHLKGVLIRSIGKRGRHRTGAFDKDNPESAAGTDEVDSAGNVWVCEASRHLNRVSVWDADGP